MRDWVGDTDAFGERCSLLDGAITTFLVWAAAPKKGGALYDDIATGQRTGASTDS